MTTPIEQARTLLRSATLPKELVDHIVGEPIPGFTYTSPPEERAAWILVNSLTYQVAISGSWAQEQDRGPYLGRVHSAARQTYITDEDAVPLGTSKYRGLPHLPSGMPWPAGMYFGAQFNLADLAQVDRSDRLPKDGMLYIFYSMDLEFKVMHWIGDVDELERRAYPDPSTLPGAEHYLDEFVVGEVVEFNPHWLVAINDGEWYDHSEALRLLPAELIEAISNILGAPPAPYDCIRRIYGRRFSCQGEFDVEDADNPKRRLVLLHDELGEAVVHVWCRAAAAARGDFSHARISASSS